MVVYVIYDQDEVFVVFDKIIVMKDGEIVQIGMLKEFYGVLVLFFIVDFMGEVNVIDCQIVGEEGGMVLVRVGNLDFCVLCGKVGLDVWCFVVCFGVIWIGFVGSFGFFGCILYLFYFGVYMEYEVEIVVGMLFIIDYELDEQLFVVIEVLFGFKVKGIVFVGV